MNFGKHTSPSEIGAPTRRLLSKFPYMCARVLSRLRRGSEEYGDRSFSQSPMVLLEELEEEAMDIVAWSYILMHRIDRMKEALGRAELDADWLRIDEGD